MVGDQECINITIIADFEFEPVAENFNVSLSNPVNALIGFPPSAIVDLLDSDGSTGIYLLASYFILMQMHYFKVVIAAFDVFISIFTAQILSFERCDSASIET